MATRAQTLHLQRAAAVCKALDLAPWTLKHKGRLGSVSAVGTNFIYKQASPTAGTLPQTTDFLVWLTSQPERVRSSQADAGDSAAGRAWIGRFRGQVPALDTSGNPISIADEDWLQGPDGLLYKVENPVPDETGAFYTFESIRQR